MAAVFADSGYWIALLDARDQLHERASSLTRSLGGDEIVTTELVLVETFNHVAAGGPTARRLAVALLRDVLDRPNIEIVPHTSERFRAAAARYEARSDQTWSLTDCASFLVMEERGIQEALAYDRDFEQAGFTALLR